METLTKDQNNLGGIARVWILPASETTKISASSTPGYFTLASDWKDHAWEFMPVFQTGSLTSNQGQSAAGIFIENVVTFRLPKINLSTKGFAFASRGRLWAILLLDQNGNHILVGDDEYPMRVSIDEKSGADLSDLNHLAVTLTNKTPNPNRFMDKPA